MVIFLRNLCFIYVLFLAREGMTHSTETPIFVSLGSYCRPAHFLKGCKMRHAAYPFDWIMSFDGEGLIKALEEDFKHFLEGVFKLNLPLFDLKSNVRWLTI